jgi:hypothetical protein
VIGVAHINMVAVAAIERGSFAGSAHAGGRAERSRAKSCRPQTPRLGFCASGQVRVGFRLSVVDPWRPLETVACGANVVQVRKPEDSGRRGDNS